MMPSNYFQMVRASGKLEPVLKLAVWCEVNIITCRFRCILLSRLRRKQLAVRSSIWRARRQSLRERTATSVGCRVSNKDLQFSHHIFVYHEKAHCDDSLITNMPALIRTEAGNEAKQTGECGDKEPNNFVGTREHNGTARHAPSSEVSALPIFRSAYYPNWWLFNNCRRVRR